MTARSVGAGRFALHEMIASAVSGDQQLEWLKLLVDAKPCGRIGDAIVWFDLPPLAVFTKPPVLCHILSPFQIVRWHGWDIEQEVQLDLLSA
jgi:hypothetical protein